MGQSWKILDTDMFPFNWCRQFFHGKFWDALNVQENNFCSCFNFKIKKYEENCFFIFIFNNSNVRVEDLIFLTSSTSFCFHKGLGTQISCHNLIWSTICMVLKIKPVNEQVFCFWLVLGSFTRLNWYLIFSWIGLTSWSNPVFELWLRVKDEKLWIYVKIISYYSQPF